MDGMKKEDTLDVKRGIINELHRPARKKFHRRKVYIKGLNDVWEIDLVEMKPYAKFNGGMKYILTVIDVLSKYAWGIPLRNKNGKDVTAAMEKVFKQSHPRKPKHIHSDQGTEFYNEHFKKLMEKKNINLYSTYTHMKASIVERFNRTLKSLMWKEFGVQGNYKWIKILPELLKKYNTNVHRTIGIRPIDVKRKHVKELLEKVNTINDGVSRTVKFKPNDIVRISKYKTLFAKGYTPSWTTELFTVDRVRKTIPPVYYLRDMNGDLIKGAFYGEEMQKTRYPDTYLVERVLKRRKNKLFIKWLGMDSSHNSWI